MSELELLEKELKATEEAVANAEKALKETERKFLSASLQKKEEENILKVLKEHLTFQKDEAKRIKEEIEDISK